MESFRHWIFILLITIVLAFAAPPKPKPTGGPSTPALGAAPASIFDLLFPQARDPKSASSSGSSFLNAPALGSPTSSSATKERSSMLGGIDFSQITRLCETMAAANRAKQMSEAVRAAAVQPADVVAWMELIRQVEPMPFETMACQLLERLITNPDEFVADLLRMIMPAANGDLSQQFAHFNQQSVPTASSTMTPSPFPALTASTAKPTPGPGRANAIVTRSQLVKTPLTTPSR